MHRHSLDIAKMITCKKVEYYLYNTIVYVTFLKWTYLGHTPSFFGHTLLDIADQGMSSTMSTINHCFY